MNSVLSAVATAPEHEPFAASYPEFFNAAPMITMHDSLAQFLGAVETGRITYRYADVVALAGHSCPVVASAFLMTRAGLDTLYPGDTPERGAIRAEFREDEMAGVTGVMANVVRLITGASGEEGFKGIGGRFDRRGLLAFGVEMHSQLCFTRIDSGARVGVSVQLDQVPMDPQVRALLSRCLGGGASAAKVAQFQRLWQNRVRSLLLNHADDPEVFTIELH